MTIAQRRCPRNQEWTTCGSACPPSCNSQPNQPCTLQRIKNEIGHRVRGSTKADRKAKAGERAGNLENPRSSFPLSETGGSVNKKKVCARRESRRVRLIHLGHLADGEIAFRVKACSESGRIERLSSLRRQSGHNVLQARNFLIDRTRVAFCLRRPDSNYLLVQRAHILKALVR
ncbi:hypothetical protein DBV15_04440 [Temnothorax longispinosus]|uniref:Uncharacterized protein n=1 Tax=Temnothorax longispinosus TaxID=300112 RepID=A0A4S2K8I8_9HYME|nr:hypothetical protein DBV15_04440 [Temnothorax longispinosus]